jgi:hypothetical protein
MSDRAHFGLIVASGHLFANGLIHKVATSATTFGEFVRRITHIYA